MNTHKWKSKWKPHVMTDQEIRDYLNGALGYKIKEIPHGFKIFYEHKKWFKQMLKDARKC